MSIDFFSHTSLFSNYVQTFLKLVNYGYTGSSYLPAGFLSLAVNGSYTLVTVRGLLIAVASLIVEHRL